MNINLDNGLKVSLTKKDFLASGGEGSVYVKGSEAFKIYTDVKKVMPKQKIKELSVLKHPSIVNPQHIVFDDQNNILGYSMKYIPRDSTFVLCELFNKAFKDRNQLSQKYIIELIKKFREQVEYCHKQNIFIVDLNEMNFLVSKTWDNIYFIDTDSYQTPSYKATAIMDSIKDVHALKFDENTDWFSFGIVTFNLLTGIHPYKGNHTITDFVERMKKNISVFNKDVKYPPFIKNSLQQIPSGYLDWYRALFEQGKRLSPPIDIMQTIVIPIIQSTHSVHANIIEILYFEATDNSTVIKYFDNNVVLTSDYFILNKKIDNKVAPYSHIYYESRINSYISFISSNGKLRAYDISHSKSIECDLQSYNIFSYGNRVYCQQEDYISEISTIVLNNSSAIILVPVAQISSKSTLCLDGFAIQNLLGTYYFSLFPESKKHYQIKISELDSYRVISGKFDKNIVMVIAEKLGKYFKFILKFNKDYDKYVCTIIEDSERINFTCLPTGVVINVNETNNLELFTIKLDDNTVKIIQDTDFSDKMLDSVDNNVIYYENNKVFNIRLK
jgi:hypothetical protein